MLHLIVNPAAGNGRASRVGAQLEESLNARGIAYAMTNTKAPLHATELARKAAESGAETVVAVGGDGTILETARGLFGTDTALGIIPAGTGNDVVKMLGTPQKPMEALDFILRASPRKMDVGTLNDTVFLNVCGTGFDVCVLRYANKAKKYVRGMLPYLFGVICTIFTYKPVVATFEVDGEEPFVKPVLLLAVANGRYLGGGMDVAPHSSPNDGLFDLVTVDNMPRWKLPFQLPKLLNGRILDIPGTSCVRCQRVTMSAKDMHVNVDGEIVKADTATFHMLHEALPVHW